MNKLLIAIALSAILSTPALAMPGAGPEHQRHVQPNPETRQNQKQVMNSHDTDPYWKPCRYSDYGDNTCE
jgi:hypothetical protein